MSIYHLDIYNIYYSLFDKYQPIPAMLQHGSELPCVLLLQT